jgi:hypothetical protein
MKKHLLTLGPIALALVVLFSIPLSRQTNASASNGFVLQAAASSSAKTATGAQAGTPNQANGQTIQAVTDSMGEMSYQGKLYQNSNPYNGLINITFSLYNVATDGTAFWQEVQGVTVTSGYFDVMLGAVTPLKPYVTDFNGQVWLGITPAGASAELTPRQLLGAVGYAMSLVPGASVVDNSAAGGGYTSVLDVEGANHNGISGMVTSSGASVGVYGENDYGSSNATDVTAETTAAIWGQVNNSAGTAVRGSITGTCTATSGHPCGGAGVSGTNTSSTGGAGVIGYSKNGNGVFGQTANSGAFGFWTAQRSHSANYSMTGALMQVVQNNGSQTLEPGDVAVFSGVSAPLSNGSVIVQVDKANGINDVAVAGVVYGKVAAAVAEGTLTADGGGLPADGQAVSQGPVAPGEYALVVVQGPAQVNVSTADGAIQVGDSLSTAAQSGLAGKVDAATTSLPGVVFAKALQPLANGEGMIYVYVTLN